MYSFCVYTCKFPVRNDWHSKACFKILFWVTSIESATESLIYYVNYIRVWWFNNVRLWDTILNVNAEKHLHETTISYEYVGGSWYFEAWVDEHVAEDLQSVSKEDLQSYSKCYFMATATKTFTLKGVQSIHSSRCLTMDTFYAFKCKSFRSTRHKVTFRIPL
jgi:hypothetical protein